jgi:4-amino-4-deoxy-L-arabinose transferase-like glycosyltransferase
LDPRRPARLIGLVSIALLALVLSALVFGDLGGGSLWNTDDALYANVVRQMIRRHSLRPSPWFDYDIAQAYPLGVRWMAMVARLCGDGLFGLRLPAALAGFATALALGLLGGPAGAAAAGLWLVQPLVHLFSQRVMHDMLLAALTAGALAFYHHAEPRRSRLLLAGLLCGLASLVKAWAGGIALATLALDLLASRRAWLRRPSAWGGLLLALGLPTLWFAAAGQLSAMTTSMSQRLLVGLPGHGPAAVAASGGAVAPGALSTIATQGPAGWLLLVLALAGITLALRRRDALDRLLLAWLAVGLLIALGTRTFVVQYALVALLPLCAIAGGALDGLARRLGAWRPAALALLLLALCAPLIGVGQLARHADDRIAALGALQQQATADALVCTIDSYHASPAFYAERRVQYLTEGPPSLAILRRVFGELTVPTLRPGELAARLDAAPAVSCIVPRARLAELRPQLHAAYATNTPPDDLPGADVVLLQR